jgi:hypothetical protein
MQSFTIEPPYIQVELEKETQEGENSLLPVFG